MHDYDPEVGPPPADWLAMNEDDRTSLVEAYHRSRQIRLPQPRLHAALHVVVENQVALGESVVVEALARLQAHGATRHEGLHALGHVVAEHIQSLMKAGPNPSPELHVSYLERVRQLGVKPEGNEAG